jgi:hypothetical protein
MHSHVYRIKCAAGTTVMRVGDSTAGKARKLANGWVATLNRTSAPGHYWEKVRNQHGAK